MTSQPPTTVQRPSGSSPTPLSEAAAGHGSASGIAAGIAAGILLLLVAVGLYHRVLGLWWMEDDFYQIRLAARNSPWVFLLDAVSRRFVTPLLFLSYDLDLALFGLDPRAFYLHQLLSLTLAALGVYLVLRGWLPRRWAWLGGLLFLLGPPVASLAPLLMARHYPESIALALFAASTFVAATRRRGAGAWVLGIASALLYLAASLAKEIAVPLPILLAFVPTGSLRRRLRLLLPHLAGTLGYSAYRAWLLGSALGRSGWTPAPGDWPPLALALPAKVARELAGPGGWGWVAVASLGAVILLGVFHRPRTAFLLGAGAAAALLPVLPASVDLEPRYATVSWLLLALGFPLAARALGRGTAQGLRPGVPRMVGLGVALAVGAGLVANRSAWRIDLARAERMSVEGRSFLALGAGDLLRHPANPPAAMEELRRFSRAMLGRKALGDWFYDDLFLCRGPGARGDYRSIWSYDAPHRKLVDVTPEIPERRERYCRSVRWQAPLTTAFRHRGTVLRWSLGPYRQGAYAFVLGEGRIRFDLPRRGAFDLRHRHRLDLRVRYQSPAGWVTYSPVLSLDLRRDGPFHWRRGKAGSGPAAPPAG